MVRKLIVTCDDCGLSEGINDATISLYQRHIATAASILTNFPATYHAYKLFAQYSSLECGVHLNLTEGYPLRKISSPSPLTLANGHFRSRVALFVQALYPTPSFIQLVEAELTAQIEHFLHSRLTLHHLTTHLHFHMVPILRSMIFRLAQKFNVEWIRTHRFTSTALPFNPLLRRGHRNNKQELSPRSFQPDYLVPIILWLGTSPETFSRQLKLLDGCVEIVVHPSTAQDISFPQGVAYLPNKRFQEMQYLDKVMRLQE